MQDHSRYLARVRSLALAAMVNATGKPLAVAGRSAPPAPPAPLPRRRSAPPADRRGGDLTPAERRRLGSLPPHLLAAIARAFSHLPPAGIDAAAAARPAGGLPAKRSVGSGAAATRRGEVKR
ncbi:MAG TPA: hypothetical protein VMY42_28210 [Thermoguttaceae bacterium]|nr:hypothetical protein [Thermoguttaceae bacterium]